MAQRNQGNGLKLKLGLAVGLALLGSAGVAAGTCRPGDPAPGGRPGDGRVPSVEFPVSNAPSEAELPGLGVQTPAQLAKWRAGLAVPAIPRRAGPAVQAVPRGAGHRAAQAPTVFFTGKPYDADLGAYLFKHRSYDPALCRWTTPDPSGFPDGANNWVYVNNGATSHFDSLGLAVTEIHGVEDISCRAYHTGSPEWILVDMSVRESIPAGGAAAVYGISVQWERRATTQYTPTGYTTKSATGGILGASSEITKGEGYYYIYPINYSFPSGFCLASSISNTIYQNIGELLGLAGDYGWGEVEGTAMVSMVKAAMTGGEEDVQLTLNDIMNSGPRDAASSYFWKDIKFVE